MQLNLSVLSRSSNGKAAARIPKLYVISQNGSPIYIGITKQGIRNRLRFGLKATGKGGYYGYAWKKSKKIAQLDLWYPNNAKKCDSTYLETIEAEVVFLIREKMKQWPKHQTEIHFHKSTIGQRKQALKVFQKAFNYSKQSLEE